MFYRIELIYFQFIKQNTQVDTIFMKNEINGIHNCKCHYFDYLYIILQFSF